LGVLILDDALHIFENVNALRVLGQCLEKAPPAHAGIEQFEIDGKPLKLV